MKDAVGQPKGFTLIGGNVDPLIELFDGSDTILLVPFPIAPLRWCPGDRLFHVTFRAVLLENDPILARTALWQ